MTQRVLVALVGIPLAVAIVWIGVLPNTLLGRMEASVNAALAPVVRIAEAETPALASLAIPSAARNP